MAPEKTVPRAGEREAERPEGIPSAAGADGTPHPQSPSSPDDPAPDGPANPRPCRGGPRYQWLERIAWREGREVWRARQEWPPRLVALKLSRDLDELRREAEDLLRVGLPWVPEVIEIGEIEVPGSSERVPALVQDWLIGVPLDAAARERSLEERLALFANLCDAVEAIHRAGLAHGDLKPANIIAGAEDEVRILDLGAARRSEASSGGDPAPAQGTDPGRATSSLAYAAPERALGGAPSVAADIHSLGVILYELIAGARPWRVEESQGTRALRRALLRSEPPSPRLVVPRLPASLEAVTLRALASHPGRRYRSSAELGAEVRRALAGEPVRARRPGAAERIVGYLGRRPAQAASVAAILLALVSAIGLGIAGSVDARAAQERAAALRGPVESAAAVLLDRVATLDLRSGTLPARRRWIELAERTIAASDLDARPGGESELEARLHRLLGDLFHEEGEVERAGEHQERARAIYETLWARDRRPEIGAELSIATVRIGDLARERSDFAIAAECYRFAIRLDRELHELCPEDLTLLDNLGYSHERVADLAWRFGDREGAREHIEKRYSIALAVYQREPTPHRAFAMLQAEGLLCTLAAADRCDERMLEHLWRSFDWGEWILDLTPDDRKVQRRHAATLIAIAGHLCEEPAARGGGDGAVDVDRTIDAVLERARGLAAEVFREDPHDDEARRLLIEAERRSCERRLHSPEDERALAAIAAIEERGGIECSAAAGEIAAEPVPALAPPAEAARAALSGLEEARVLAARGGMAVQSAEWLPDPLEAWLVAFFASCDHAAAAAALEAVRPGARAQADRERLASQRGEGER